MLEVEPRRITKWRRVNIDGPARVGADKLERANKQLCLSTQLVSLENIQETSARSVTMPLENVMGVSHACQVSLGVQLSAGLPFFNSTPIMEEGPFMGFSGSYIDFQNHVEAQAVSVEHDHFVGIKPNPIPPTVADSVLIGQPQKKYTGVEKKTLLKDRVLLQSLFTLRMRHL